MSGYRAKFYRNDKNLKINSFRHGGGLFTLERTGIFLDLDEPLRMFEQVEAALSVGTYPDVFVWAGAVAYIGSDGIPKTLTHVTAPIVVGRLVKFYTLKQSKSGEWERVRAELPDKLWKAWLEKGCWKLPVLQNVVAAPYSYKGESILNEGYNPASGLYLSSDFSPPDIKTTSKEAALSALEHLRSIISGFPFETTVDESVALAMMLTAVQRATLETAPLFVVSSNTPGTGKTQLATGIASLMIGKAPHVHGYRDNEQEFAKMLMSVLLHGAPSLIVDNVKLGVALGGDALCSILSSPLYVDRELGFSRIRTVSTRVLAVATGNNLKLASDVTRRTLMIRLDARCERPELREFDKIFVQVCLEQRIPILQSVLTILSAYHHVAGRPKVEHIRLGSFEQWSDEICAPLVWLGIPDPSLGLAKAEADEGVAGLGELLAIWQNEVPTGVKLTASEMLKTTSPYRELRDFFCREFDDRGGPTARKVGRLLSKYAGRVVDGRRLVIAGTSHRIAEWKLEDVE